METDSKPTGQRVCLYSTEELDAVLDAMARRLAAWLEPTQPLALIGLLRRGEPLARLLQQRLAAQHGFAAPLYPLKVKRYADDLRLLHAETALEENPALAGLDLPATRLLVIDDVLYGGHSLLRVCAYLARLGAREICTAVLVDRCVGTQPVHADVVGVRLQIAPGDIVECNVPPYEAELRIDLLRRTP